MKRIKILKWFNEKYIRLVNNDRYEDTLAGYPQNSDTQVTEYHSTSK